MADNTTLNSGSGGDSIGTDDIGGVKYPRGKLIHGADGTNDGDVAITNPLPVTFVPRTDKVSDGTTTLVSLAPAVVAAASAGDNTIVAATASKKITVYGYVLVASGGANTVRWEDGASGTALTGQMDIADNGQLIVMAPAGMHLLQCSTNTLLNLELANATSVAGHIIYALLP